jgi:hypothetical protein
VLLPQRHSTVTRPDCESEMSDISLSFFLSFFFYLFSFQFLSFLCDVTHVCSCPHTICGDVSCHTPGGYDLVGRPAVSHWSLAVQARVGIQGGPFGTCVRQSGTGSSFSTSCQRRSTAAPYSHTFHLGPLASAVP